MNKIEIEEEIERRFWVKSHTLDIEPLKPKDIIQGYFSSFEDSCFRVRITNNNKSVMTGKTGIGKKRTEENILIPLYQARMMVKYTPFILHKTRYVIDDWEVDFYHNNLDGLVIAEKEMDSDSEKIEIPDWLTDYEEVTETVTNLHLAELSATIKDETNKWLEPLKALIKRNQSR